MAEAARLGDEITHSFALAGVVAGAVAGAAALAVGVAVIGFSVLTFGLGGVLAAVVGAAVIGGALSGGAAIGEELGSMMEVPCGGIAPACSPDVFTNARNAARTDLDFGLCSGMPPIGPPHPYPASILAEGSATVFINLQHAVRKGERTACDAKVSTGSDNVYIGGPSVQTRPIETEVPGWVNDLILYTGIASALILLPVAPGLVIGGLVGGVLGGKGGSALGGAIFGEGSKGQRLMGLAGTLFGGGAGARTGAGLQRGIGSRICNTNCDRVGKLWGGEPVDVISGEVFIEECDFELPWRIPLVWSRFYSSQRQRLGAVGWGWQSWADARLQVKDDGSVDFWDGKIAPINFPYLPWAEESVTDPFEGHTLTTNVRSVQVQTRQGVTYEFARPKADDREIYLACIADLSGNSVRFHRSGGVLHEVRSSDGPWLEIISEKGLLKKVLLHHPCASARTLIRYEHSPAGELLANFDALENPHTYRYQNRRLFQHTNRNGVTFRYAYEGPSPEARCVRTWGSDGLYDYRFHYDPIARRTSYTDSLGGEWTADYDEYHFLTRHTNPLGAATSYEYDPAGHPSAVIDPLGRRTDYTYSEKGELLSFTRPDGASIRYIYDHRSCLTCLTDAAGNTWAQEWDEQRRLSKRITPLGHVHEYTYTRRGDVAAYKNPNGATTRFERDPYSDGVLAVINPLGHRVSWEIDPLGRVTRYVDEVGAVTAYERDPKGRITRIARPTGAEVHCRYDREMNMTEYCDELGHITHFEYCGLNELSARHLPDGSTVRYQYDTEERLIAVVNGRGERYRIDRDLAGRVIRRVDYWGGATELRRDPAGEIVERLDPLKRLTVFDRDLLGRLRSRRYEDGAEERFSYDSLGNLLEFRNIDATVACEFDADGRLLSETQNGFKVEFTYDGVGNCVSRSSTVGNVVAYRYNAANQFTALAVNGATVLTVDCDPRGLPIREQLGERLTRHRKYDAEWRPTEQRLTAPARNLTRREYRYDPSGRLRQHSESEGRSALFDYDPVGRLIRHQDPEGAIHEFRRDAAGDFVQKDTLELGDSSSTVRTSMPVESEATAPTAHRGIKFDDSHYRFDSAGNIIEIRSAQDRTRLHWNEENRLSKALTSVGLASYRYDALGRRIEKCSRDETTRFGWDHENMMAEQTARGFQEYVYYPNSFVPAVTIVDSNVYYHHNEINGAPVELLSSDGDLCWRGEHSAFESSVQTEVIANPLRRQGQYYDSETGLCYNRHRYYSPAIGSFLSQDPLGLSAGDNLYLFALDTWNWADPLGLACDVVSANSRRQALKTAQEHAQVPRASKGGEPIGFDELNPQSRGPNAGRLQQEGATSVGRRDPATKAEFMDHPDGHPHMVGPDQPPHHSSPHVHGVNRHGQEIIVTYPPKGG